MCQPRPSSKKLYLLVSFIRAGNHARHSRDGIHTTAVCVIHFLEKVHPPPTSAFNAIIITRPFFSFRAKTPLHTGVRTRCHYLISLSVCMWDIRRFYWLRELYEANFRKPGIYASGRVWANVWGAFLRGLSRGGRGRRAAVTFVVCFPWGGIFSCFP